MFQSSKTINIGIATMVVLVFVTTAVVHISESDWTATGTVCMAGLAGIGIVYSSLTVTLMRAENRPHVIVDFVLDRNVPGMIDIELSNHGKGSACQISIEVTAPKEENEMAERNTIIWRMCDAPIFKNEIQFLAPEKSITIMYGTSYMVREYTHLEYTFKLTYKDVYEKSYKDVITTNPNILVFDSSEREIDTLLESMNQRLDQLNRNLEQLNDSIESASKNKTEIGSRGYGGKVI